MRIYHFNLTQPIARDLCTKIDKVYEVRSITSFVSR